MKHLQIGIQHSFGGWEVGGGLLFVLWLPWSCTSTLRLRILLYKNHKRTIYVRMRFLFSIWLYINIKLNPHMIFENFVDIYQNKKYMYKFFSLLWKRESKKQQTELTDANPRCSPMIVCHSKEIVHHLLKHVNVAQKEHRIYPTNA